MGEHFQLTKAAVEHLAEKYGTPLLVLSENQIERNYTFLRDHLPGVKLHYAMKSNPEERIVRRAAQLGSYFDVASDGEMLTLSRWGITGERIIYANPVKTESGMAAAKRTGVYKFTFDSKSEIVKLAKSSPGGTVLLRVRVYNSKALIDLNEKFGTHPDEVMELLTMAKEHGLDVAGLCFNVGSQVADSEGHVGAIQLCRRLFDQAAAQGFHLRILDIGGGFPIPFSQRDLDIETMLDNIQSALQQYFPATEIWAEPGRFICGTAVNLITRIIGTQERNRQPWYFLDDGIYGTFSGILFDHWDFEPICFKEADAMIRATFAGPSCDSIDVLFKDKITPPLEVGDVLLVPNCGAYTSASATVFNGFAKTPVIVWEDEEKSGKNQVYHG